MEEEKKIRYCPDCGKVMASGILDPYRYIIFRRDDAKKGLLDRLFEGTEDVLPTETLGATRYYGWICADCKLVLFDYSDSRAGLGRSLFDTVADGIEGAFDALDRHFGGWNTEEENQKQWETPAKENTVGDKPAEAEETEESPAPETPPVPPVPPVTPVTPVTTEKRKKRIITSSGVREVDDEV